MRFYCNSLVIDTCSDEIRVAFLRDGVVVCQLEQASKMQHSQLLHPLIEKVLAKSQITLADLSDIWVAVGPGSYTGIRVGVVTATTMADTLQIPVHGFSTLAMQAEGLRVLTRDVQSEQTLTLENTDLIISTIDARGKRLYCACYLFATDKLTETIPPTQTVDTDFVNLIENFLTHTEYSIKRIVICGNGALIAQEILATNLPATLLNSQNVQVIDLNQNSAVLRQGFVALPASLQVDSSSTLKLDATPLYCAKTQAERNLEQK